VVVFQLVELGEQKLAMNGQIAETDVRFSFEVRIQRGDEIWHIGALQFLQDTAALIGRKRHLIANQRGECVLREALQATIIAKRVIEEDFTGDPGLIEGC
jgi:hypothetical protein